MERYPRFRYSRLPIIIAIASFGVLVAACAAPVPSAPVGNAETPSVVAVPTATQPPVLPIAEPNTEAVNLNDGLKRWADAYAVIRTLRGSQAIAIISEDGTRPVLPEQTPFGDMGAPHSSDELYDKQAGHLRFHFVAHDAKGDVVTIWDGKNAYRYFSWLHEVYRPLPESYASGAYWIDDVDDQSLLMLLAPQRGSKGEFQVPFDLIGTRSLDNRKVIELLVKPSPNRGSYGLYGIEGNRFYLDAATFLPYRVLAFISPPTSVGRRLAAE